MTLSEIHLKDRLAIEILGYNLGTPVLEPHKRELKTNQNDTILTEKATKNRTCNEQEKEFE